MGRGPVKARRRTPRLTDAGRAARPRCGMRWRNCRAPVRRRTPTTRARWRRTWPCGRDPMAPLTVDPSVLDGAGAEVLTAAVGLGSVISTLTAALSGCAGMAGDDPVGAALGRSYDGSAAK